MKADLISKNKNTSNQMDSNIFLGGSIEVLIFSLEYIIHNF